MDWTSTRRRLRKLRKMSTAEIAWRVREKWRQRRERVLWKRGGQRPDHAPISLNLLAPARALVSGCSSEQLAQLQREFPACHRQFVEDTQQRAQQILAGRWTMLGHAFDLTGEIDWHRDPRTGYSFPRAFYADVPLLQDSGGPVDVKYVWELGRQQYLAELARAWLLSGQPEFARRARAILLDWIRQNPVYEGVHWTSSLEVAVRSISWIWTLAGLAEWSDWLPDELSLIAHSLAEHAEYLHQHFSLYSSPYNHLIGEATGLYLLTHVLKEHPAARLWRDASRRVLSEHGPRQFYADGFCVEQATGYHFYTLGFLTLAVIAARRAGEPLPDLEEVVRRGYRAGAAFQQPDGRWPAIGDVDSARALPVHPDDFWDFTGLYSLAAACFQDPSLKLPHSQPGAELFWLLGTEGLKTWHTLPYAQTDHTTLLPESGYAIHRQGGNWVLLDAGPIAHGLHADATPSTAHGHLDVLQVLCFLEGLPVLIDPGMPFYYGDPDWVRHFRSAAAHNTLEIEGLPWAQDAGGLSWSHVLLASELTASEQSGTWTAVGRVKWSNVFVERYVLAHPSAGIGIADYVELDQPRRVRWSWYFADLSVVEGMSLNPLRPNDGLAWQSWATEGQLQTRTHRATSTQPQAWLSNGYGDRKAGCRIVEDITARRSLLKLTWLGRQGLPLRFVRGSLAISNVGEVQETFLRYNATDSARWEIGRLSSAPCMPAQPELAGKHRRT